MRAKPSDPIPVETEATAHAPQARDLRPTIPEPPPVRLIAVENVRHTTVAGLEKQLDDFYVRVLRFVRSSESGIKYEAERHSIVFDIVEQPRSTEDYHPTGIVVRSLAEVVHELSAADVEFQRQKSITPGIESILLQDLAGNWVEIHELTELV